MILGITGGIGSGKSKVLHFLQSEYGAHIIEADSVSKELMKPGESAYERALEAFPETMGADGNIDRAALSDIVFADESKLELLNSIIHPLVRRKIDAEIKRERSGNPGRLIVIEAALLLEAGYRDICDEVWYIYCETAIRKRRLMESRGYTEDKINDVMSRQLSEEQFRRLTDYTVNNSGSIEDTFLQIKNRFSQNFN